MWNMAQEIFNQLPQEQRRAAEERINTHITHYQRMPLSVCSPSQKQDSKPVEQEQKVARPK